MEDILKTIDKGFLFIIGGTIASVALTIIFQHIGIGILFWGAILYGIILVILGIVNLIRYFIWSGNLLIEGAVGVNRGKNYFYKMFRRALIYLALSDGILEKEEIKLIKLVIKKSTGINLGIFAIKRIERSIRKKGLSLKKYFINEVIDLHEKVKEAIIAASLMVITRDGIIDYTEQERFTEVMTYFGISEEEVNSVVDMQKKHA